MTPRYLGLWVVTTPRYKGLFWIFSRSNFATPRCIGHVGVATLWGIDPREVATLLYIGHQGVMGSYYTTKKTISMRPSSSKMLKNFFRMKKICTDLNLEAITMIVDILFTYNLYKYKIDSIKIRA